MHVSVYSKMIVGTALCIVVLSASTGAFEYSGYCQKMCMWGRGGNLCKCNAVHFAGKRGHTDMLKNGEDLVDYDMAAAGNSRELPETAEEGSPLTVHSSGGSRGSLGEIRKILASMYDGESGDAGDKVQDTLSRRMLTYAIRKLTQRNSAHAPKDISWDQLLADSQAGSM